MNARTLTLPPLVSGGLMLTYRCTNACRHCLYRCSPAQPDDRLAPATRRRVFEALRREPELTGLHIAGGEPTLHMDLLLDVLRAAGEAEVPVDYVETNAAWCRDRAETRAAFLRLREAGLRAVLVSASMFHNEFVPFRCTRTCVEVARDVFGYGGVIVWLARLYDLLARMPDEGTHTLAEFCQWAGIPEDSPRLPELYGVIPGGRAPQALRRCYTPRPAEAFADEDCRDRLLDTTHFHIDPHGHLFTGCCAGIVVAVAPDLHPAMEAAAHPVFATLCAEGPVGLMRVAAGFGFVPRPDGYASKCDLCFDARRHLRRTGAFSELQPAAFYEG